jgi:cytochrome c oxidase subunit 1
MAKTTEFRTCPTTGLKVDLTAEKLIKANAVVAVVFLAIGGLFGLLVALTRWPAVHFLPADWFYLALTAHGFDVLLVWIIFFEMAVLYFASAVLLGSRLAGPKWAWAAFVMMLAGALITNVVVLQGQSSVMFTSYVPMRAEPGFYLGIILFAVGALIGCGVFFGTLVVARRERTYEGSVPLVTFGAITAAIIAVFTIASGAIILVPTLVCHRGHGAGREAAVGKGQPDGVSDVHPVPATRQRAPYAGGARLQLRMEDIQHQLRDVSRGARQHDPRHDRAGIDRGGAAQPRSDERPVRVAA